MSKQGKDEETGHRNRLSDRSRTEELEPDEVQHNLSNQISDNERHVVDTPRQELPNRVPLPPIRSKSANGAVSPVLRTELVSTHCQTEWSWLQDFTRLQALQAQEERQQPTPLPETDDDEDSSDYVSDAPTPRATKQTALAENDSTTRSETSETRSPDSVRVESPVGVPELISLRDDDYGIPVHQLQYDSDGSEVSPGKYHEYVTLPSVGPPRIIQYIRESELRDLDLSGPENLEPGIISRIGTALARLLPVLTPSMLDLSAAHGIFQGVCEFCGNAKKPFPTVEQQMECPSEELYCCDEYRQFVQAVMMLPMGDLHKKTERTSSTETSENAQRSKTPTEEIIQRLKELLQRRRDKGVTKLKKTVHIGRNRWANQTRRIQDARKNKDNAGPRQLRTINFSLTCQQCVEDGWTVRPPSPVPEQQEQEEIEVFIPQPTKDHGRQEFVRRFYPNGDQFLIFFPDGTGTIFYPSGRVAVSVVALEEPGFYSYIVSEDRAPAPRILAVFEHNGYGCVHFNTGALRLCIDPSGGVEFDARGQRRRKWTWSDQMEHVHAPPIQPITVSVNQQVALRIADHDHVSLTFTAHLRSARFQVGSQVKVQPTGRVPAMVIEENRLWMQEIRNRTQEVLLKVHNMVKFPKSPKLEKIPNPPHLIARQQRTARLRTLQRERTVSSGFRERNTETETPVVVVE